ncbi:nicotinate-nicotinamide nucleotide adenylyltransferase [Prevotella intermedia]|uniref:Probable nicotinate-nucleotide adenylyltransferase n=1 Tax=Prevotella intermedia TaxID=28131 RepID=A0AAJ3RSR6_PREIN|nr:nicotinate (nicotinamide) nucleotide adenylyltransferase [Prevotella intermedia]PJI20085.1 nicotinate-nicotinamide nucleotide adenylyltransferase [Prevotella intermedia]
MKVGIYGGSFNPIHSGHIKLAEIFLQEACLDEVWFMVSPQNPFKINDKLLDDTLRLQLVRKALNDKKGMVACDYEFRLPKPSYTWDTLQRLSADFPTYEFVLLIGGDNWQAFDKWYHAEDILANYRVAVYPRKSDETVEKCHTLSSDNVTLLNIPLINISSTDIRLRIKNGHTIKGLVPECIEKDVEKYYNGK